MDRNAKRTGISLIELLVSITIVTLLATAVLFGMSNMQDLAKTNRTRATIAKLHGLIMERWETYEGRRIDLAPRNESPFLSYFRSDGSNYDLSVYRDSTNSADQVMFQMARLCGLYELMRYELPDRQSDIESDVLGLVLAANAGFPLPSRTPMGQPLPGRTRDYFKQIQANAKRADWGLLHQGAECLYLIVAQMQVDDTSAIELFRDEEIGDVDGDGMREFIDGWGNPIRFLRWPGAFISPYHPADSMDSVAGIQPFELPPDAQDPFDLIQVNALYRSLLGAQILPSFRLRPLIVSAGPDGEFGMGFDRTNGTWLRGGSSMPGLTYDVIPWNPVDFPDDLPNYPFNDFGGSGPLGEVEVNGSNNRPLPAILDNITNHQSTTGL